MSLNAMYMIGEVITGAFEHRVGRWQGTHGTDGRATDKQALLVLFKVKNQHIQMLIHAPANYVGVYVRKGKGKWSCVSYHDSCWRSDGVERFLFDHRDDIHFSFIIYPFKVEEIGQPIERITDAIYVIKLSEEQLAEFSEIRKKKYS
jgi:hypothetical protein